MLYDILEVDSGFIFPGDGGAHIEIKFRLVVFRPFVGEVLSGKIRSSTEEGICGKLFVLLLGGGWR
jgi:DNA-directed RNA polymerase subunit E'/Rpb7